YSEEDSTTLETGEALPANPTDNYLGHVPQHHRILRKAEERLAQPRRVSDEIRGPSNRPVCPESHYRAERCLDYQRELHLASSLEGKEETKASKNRLSHRPRNKRDTRNTEGLQLSLEALQRNHESGQE